jgi:hypothetical protein
MQGSVGAIMGAVGLIKKLVGGNGSAKTTTRTPTGNGHNGDGTVKVENFRSRSNGTHVEDEYHVDVFRKG